MFTINIRKSVLTKGTTIIRVIHESNSPEGAHNVLVHPLEDEELNILLRTIYISPYAPERFDMVVKGTLKKVDIESDIIHSNDYMKAIRY